jgi:steroid 5-alpha reductase family enzyme
MAAWFLLAQLRQRNDVADTAWGLGFAVVAWAALLRTDQETSPLAWLVTGLVTVWGIRLAAHIYTRNRKKSEDSRYKQIVPDGGSLRWLKSYFKVFVLQGALLWVVALPIQAVHFTDTADANGWIVRIGLVLWVVGFYFEAQGDYELRKFLARPRRPKVLDAGLWRYTRHPNYFGEVTLWWGVYVMVLAGSTAWWTVIGPLTITYLILFVSGVPLLERRYAHDRAYQQYAAKTSKFIPLPPRQ